MQSLEFNKAFAALLTAGLTFGLAGQLGKFLVHGEKPHETAIAIADAAPVAAAPAAAALEPVSGLIANADVESGKTRFGQQCGICHSPNEGGKNGVGPNLWSVLGGPHGHAAGFNYSDALKGKQGPWTYEGMNAWLAKPAAYAPGTRMAYAGLPSVQQRAEIIAYIRTLSATPIALPAAVAAVVAPAAAAATPLPPLPLRLQPTARPRRSSPICRISRACSPVPILRTARRSSPSNAASATPRTRVGATVSAPICGTSSGATTRRPKGSTTRPRTRRWPTTPGLMPSSTSGSTSRPSICRGRAWFSRASPITRPGRISSPICGRSRTARNRCPEGSRRARFHAQSGPLKKVTGPPYTGGNGAA